MRQLFHALRARSLYIIIFALGLALASLVQWKYKADLEVARDHYRREAHDQTESIAYDAERVFRSMYQGMRTIALLPGVRSIDRYGTNFDSNARQTTQELYNNLASNVAMSEVYIVPLDMHPDEIDAHMGKLQEPITTFDQLIVGRHADQGKIKKEEDESGLKVPEIEIYEYRLMRKQMDWLKQHFPREENVAGLEFPALCGPEVITCDNSRYSPMHPDDKDRSGLVYVVPFYGLDGKLKGCIAGVILTHALRELLPSGNYVLQNRSLHNHSPHKFDYAYTAPSHEAGAWQSSPAWVQASEPDPGLLYSEVRKLKVRDGSNRWTLWAGQPNTQFWARTDVQSAQRFALVGYLAAGLLTVGLGVIAGLARRHRRAVEAKNRVIEMKNAELEDRVQQRTAELENANRQLHALATTDGMTGLANHRTFQERLRECATRAEQGQQALALLLMDVDKFKQYNDTYGHPAGDQVLKTLARLLHESVDTDGLVARCIARYGGEEFAVLLTDAAAEQAAAVAERIRACVEQHSFTHRRVTLSIGVALYNQEAKGPEYLVTRADQALYTAKRGGRNRVVFAGDLLLIPAEPEAAHLVTDGATFLTQLLAEPVGQVMTGLMLALDARDAETEGHSERVVRYALRLAEELEAIGLEPMTPKMQRELAVGALLHDIGKMSVPDSILLKAGQLTDEEWAIMRTHPDRGIAILSKLPQAAAALPLVRSHHERWDGMGYPEGLRGEAIPLTARLFALVDTFDAMSSDRPYRSALPYNVIQSEISAQSGKQFDPSLVRAFLNITPTVWSELRGGQNLLQQLHTPESLAERKAA